MVNFFSSPWISYTKHSYMQDTILTNITHRSSYKKVNTELYEYKELCNRKKVQKFRSNRNMLRGKTFIIIQKHYFGPCFTHTKINIKTYIHVAIICMLYSLPKQQTITENISFTDNCFKLYTNIMIVKEERNMYAGQLKRK